MLVTTFGKLSRGSTTIQRVGASTLALLCVRAGGVPRMAWVVNRANLQHILMRILVIARYNRKLLHHASDVYPYM
jgi:hypothetical protein